MLIKVKVKIKIHSGLHQHPKLSRKW